MSKILVTGAAGFIGFHLCQRLLREGKSVVGLDNLNEFYDVNLKKARLGVLRDSSSFEFARISLEDGEKQRKLFEDNDFSVVVNLAAQAGVRYSLENPMAYVNSNLVGFVNILENVRHHKTPHLVYASSSSVYGANRTMPFSERHNVDHPVSLYAATKKSNELMAHSYSSLFNIPMTGLRFFTVYGPWGRPDMAIFKFTKAILEGKPIDVYNRGDMRRDFTYIDDIVDGVVRVMDRIPKPDPKWRGEEPTPGSSYAPYRIFNIGNNKSEQLTSMIEEIEKALGKKAEKNMLPMQAGDVKATAANIDALQNEAGFEPKTSISEGIPKFIEWYREYYGV
ncbi:UDP-glucose 4-epimerase [hydrothermal vent metagenome]|uniref:UDP-glucose 4-epimerase n=1 Tax=hydrothermal vent metagenome TaxID=652676 RepID=A0A3B1BYK7_9ZZZZ